MDGRDSISRSTASRTYLVYTLPIELRAAHADLWKTIEADFETDRVFRGTLGGGEVYVLHNRVPSNQALGISPR